jgi:hypothetical protein
MGPGVSVMRKTFNLNTFELQCAINKKNVFNVRLNLWPAIVAQW